MSQVRQGLRKWKRKKSQTDNRKPESARTGLGSGGRWGHQWLCLQKEGLGGLKIESKQIMLHCPGRSSLASFVPHNLNFKPDHFSGSISILFNHFSWNSITDTLTFIYILYFCLLEN